MLFSVLVTGVFEKYPRNVLNKSVLYIPMSSSNYLVDWARRVSELDPTQPLKNPHMLDSDDHVLGVLSDDMKRYWLFLESLGEMLDANNQKIDDLYACFSADMETLGNSFLRVKGKEYIQKLTALAQENHPTLFAYSLNRLVFDEMLRDSFTPVDGKSVLGIRDGYQVVCRKYNNRGDYRNKVDDYRESMRRFSQSLRPNHSILDHLWESIALAISRMDEGEGLEGTTPEAPGAPATDTEKK